MTVALPADKPSTVSLLARDIKLAHSVFALPFALLGACYAVWASGQTFWTPRSLGQMAIIIACMVLARTWAMLVNRLADRDIDRANARTRQRVIASGAVATSVGWTIAATCALGFVVACGLFWAFFNNPWPLSCSLPVLTWLGAYSYTKRFTWLCHLWLGASLAIAPICAALALNPAALLPPHPPTIWLIAGFVMAWVAGFDIIYSLQDQHFDRERGLFSIPAKLGWRGALWVSRGLHLVGVALLLAAWRLEPAFTWLWGAAVLLTCGLLVLEHAALARLEARNLRAREDGSDNPPPALNLVFFTLNGVVSCVVGFLGLAQLVVSKT